MREPARLVPGGRDPLLRATAVAMVLVDVGFVVYWSVVALGVVPAERMFAEYADPRVAAWNWSFLPLDLLASASGLSAVRALHRGAPGTVVTVRFAVSLALTAVAGGMALAYWVLRGQLDPVWIGANLALVAVAAPTLTRVLRTGDVRATGRPRGYLRVDHEPIGPGDQTS